MSYMDLPVKARRKFIMEEISCCHISGLYEAAEFSYVLLT